MKTNFTSFNLREIAKWARLIVALIAFISIAQISQAQSSRFNNWYFGNNAGVSFASGSPVALTNGQLSTTEGCASISDASGNLMFYTNGINVWNRNHLVMSNGSGLTGHTSSTQSAIIVQKPLSTNIYYIFTSDADVGANGIRYSEVNMNLAGGLGAVTATKNVLLRTPSSEKLTAVRHCNNRDLWIVTHDWSSNGFRTWLVTPTGVNTTPVTSSAGTVINGINQSAYGQLKSNPDGNKLLAGYYGLTGGGINKFELYDFNNSTGVVSNAITLATETGAYGCEFSPNGRIAYGGTNGGRLVQFDLCSGIAATIQASKYVVGVLGPFIGSMQLGPDGKVYVSRNATSLSVINNPNTYGAGCNFVNAAVSLAGRGSTMGLPNMASFYMRPEVIPFTYAANCLNVSFTSPSANSSANSCASSTSAIVGAQWNFNDPSSGASNTSTTLNASHTFSSTGLYQVELILNLGCYYDTIIQPVNVTGFTLNTSSTNASCGATNGTATATPAIAGVFSYAWSNGQTTQTATGLSAGNYTVLVTSTSGCSSTASVTVASSGSLTGTVSKTNVACFGNSTGTGTANASGGTAPYSYVWSNGATSASVSNLIAGNYSVVMSDASGCSFTQTIVISQPTVLDATASSSNASCFGGFGSATVIAIGGTSPYSYVWTNGQTTSSVTSLLSGNYTVLVSDANGCSVNRTATVSQPTALSVSLYASAITCNGSANGSLTSNVSGGTSPYSYVWSNASTASQIQNLSPGTYTLTVTDAALCSANATSTLTQPAAISVNTSSTNASCGSTNGTATATPASAGVYTYSWSNGQTTQTATGLAGGNYTVTVTASNSCTASASVTVGSSGSVTGTVSKTDVACFGNSTGTGTANASGGTSPYTYVWSNGATSASISNVAAGNYSVVMSDASGCSYTQAIVISQPTALSVSLNASAITCNGSANGSLTSNVSGGTSPYSYVWSNASTASQIQNLSPGTFTLTVTDAALCSATATSTLTQPVAILVNTSYTNASCGSSNGTATATPVIAGVYTYLWSNGQTTQTATGLAGGNYTVTMTDANSCSATASVTVGSSGSVTGTVSKTDVACFGNSTGSATANASGGTAPYSYVWSNGATSASVSNLSSGNYSVVMSDVSGCTFTQSIVISQPTVLAATTSSTDAVCFGGLGSASVSASGGTSPYTYVWSNGQSTSNASALASGNYTVVVSDANGCSVNRSAVVSEPIALSISLTSSDITCNGLANGSITSSVSGGNSPYSYVWSNASTASQIQNLSPGTYTLTVTDAASCSATASSTLTQPAVLSLSTSSTNASCGATNGTATASPASAGVYTYLWSDGQTTQTATGLTGGNYTVTMTDANSCSATASVTVGSSGSVTGTVTKTDVACFGNSTGTATANASGGTSPYTYVWSNGVTSASVSNLAAGNYSVVMSDASGCSFTQAVVISQPTALSQTSSFTPVSCYGGSNGSAQLTVSGGTQPYSYVWNIGTDNATISNVSAGVYSCIITDANGCESISPVVITAPAQLTATANIIQPSCNTANGYIQLNVQGGVGTYNYLWNSGGVNSTLNGLQAGNYLVTITDQNACSISMNETLVSMPPFSVFIDGDTLLCAGEETQLSARTNGIHNVYSYFWNHGVTGAEFMANPSETTLYTVTVQDTSGCVSQASINIQVNPLPVVSIVADAMSGCAPFCTNLQAVSSTATSFNWNMSNGAFYSGADVFPCFSLPGSYTIEMAAKDDAGCSAIINWDGVIQVNASPQAIFTVSDDDVSLDEPTIEFNNNSIGANEYTYYFGDSYQGTSNYSNTTYTYRDSGNYEVMLVVENTFGCSDTAFHTIHVGGLTSFYIPTSFSPSNTDGLNDVFMPKSIGMSETGYTMSIYDRWGHLVFESNSWAKGWDGFNNGTPVQQDVYVCKVRYRELSGRINEAIGSVTVAE